MPTLKSYKTQETLQFNVADLTYLHYSGGFHLEIDCALSTPEHTLELGTVYTGPNLGEELRTFNFLKNFHYQFCWENECDGADWWINRKGGSDLIDVEFVFGRMFHVSDSADEEEKAAITEDILDYARPIRAAQRYLPGLKLRANGVQRIYPTNIRRLVDRSLGDAVILESQAHITTIMTELQPFLQVLLREIGDAEDRKRGAGLIA